MDEVFLTKTCWGHGLFVASLQCFLVVLACYLRFVVELFLRREFVLGVIFSILFMVVGAGWSVGVLAGVIVGWRQAREWKIRAWMTVWAIALLAAIINMALSVWLIHMTMADWQKWFGWLPTVQVAP